jgi:NAD(P)H-hydrate epimerase
MKITTAAEMREIDRVTSERFGVPSLVLMEKAGTHVANFALSEFPGARKITIVCGKGNNGGDGFVAARKLHEAGKQVGVLLLADPAELHGDAASMFSKMPVQPLVVRTPEELRNPAAQELLQTDLLIDAILGTGFRPPVTGLYAEAINSMNTSAAPVIAVDIPSGADADSFAAQEHLMARAEGIVTFTAPRPAHVFGMLTRGRTLIGSIGSPEESIVSVLHLQLSTARDIAPLLARRALDANKGRFGHVLTVGGSVGKAGAAAMAGMAALRVGAGLSTVATARSALPTVAGFAAELMTEPLAETEAGSISMRALEYGKLDSIAEGKTVLAVGPGISRHTDTIQVVRAIVSKYRTPMVLDADGLNAFEGEAGSLDGNGRTLVLTPHPGEMARLTGLSVAEVQRDRVGTARRFAREHGIILVLKGYRTLIASPDETVWVNPTGNPGMATGGTGDVLTGMIAGMIAQHPTDVLRAVVAAVYLHGLAGDVGRDYMGEQALVATDLLTALPETMQRVRQQACTATVSIG